MKVHYKFLPVALAFAAVLFMAAAPAMAQDSGNAAPGYSTTAEVNNTGAFKMGTNATGVPDGVTQVGAFVVGGTAYFTVNTNAAGVIHAWIDQDDDDDFVDNDGDQVSLVVGAGGDHHLTVPLNGTTAGVRWFRFIFEDGAATVTDPDTDYSVTGSNDVDGEIEDYQFTVIGSGNPVTFATTAGGVTTTVDLNGANVEVNDGTNDIFSAPLANITSLTINGDNAADDSFVIDMTAGDPIPASGITVNGQGQASSDDLTITDGTNNTTVTHNFTNANDGSVVVTDGTINYTGLEPITDNVPATNRVFNFNANAETIILDDDATGGNSIGTVDSDFGEIVTFVVPSATITLNAAGGNDDITVRQVDSAYGGTVTVNGDGDNDELIVDFNSGDPIPTAGIGVIFDGGAGTDFVRLSDAGATNQTTVTHNSIDSDEATVVVGSLGTIDINGVEDATRDELRATTKIFNGTAGVDGNALLGDGSGADFGEFDSDETPSVEFNVTDTENIVFNLGGGDDTITVEQIDAGWGGDAADNIIVNGDGGDDKMIVNFDNPLRDPIPFTGTGITFNGGADDDSVQFDGTTTFDSVVHTGTTTSAGSSTFTSTGASLLGTVAYTGIEDPTVDNMTAVTAREFTLTASGDTVTLDDGGSDGDDIARYQSNTQPTVLFNLAGTSSVAVTGGTGDDTINLEQMDSGYGGSLAANPAGGSDALVLTFNTGDDPIPGGGISFDGGTTGSNVDTIELNGTALQGFVTYVDTGAEAGSISQTGIPGPGSETITYTNIEGGITDSRPATLRTFDFTALGASTLTFDDESAVSDNLDKMVSTVSQDIVYRSPGALEVNAGDSDNTIIVRDLDNNFSGNITVLGEAGDDVLDVDWESNTVSPLAGVATFSYSGGGNTATGDVLRLINTASDTDWSVVHTYATASSGTVSVDGAANAISYAAIEPIYDFLDAASRTFTFPDADVGGVDDIIFLDADNYTSAHSGTLNNFIGTSGSTFGDSNTSEETHFYSDATLTSVTINGGTGDDYFDL